MYVYSLTLRRAGFSTFAAQVKKLEAIVPTLMAGSTKEYLKQITQEFTTSGLSQDIAKRVATYRAMYTALNIIEVAMQQRFDLQKTAKVYFEAGERVHLLWFRDQIARDSREGHWNALARLTLRDQLDAAQRALTVAIMESNKKESDTTELINRWIIKNQHALDKWNKMLAMLQNSSNIEYTMFFIAMRELTGIIHTSQ
jgi:glutamate dehydrogenase